MDEIEDEYDRCHICGIVTEEKCDFDVEMNYHIEPQPCCGCHGCAMEV